MYLKKPHIFLRLLLCGTLLFSPATISVTQASAPPLGLISLSPSYVPPLIKGVVLDPQNPFHFDFLLDTGHSDLTDQQTKEESEKLIKYFLAALTIPEEELWVNLSPDEPERIISDELAQTDMGRDMLAQDYLLKQLTASLLYPENDLGKDFWKRVYAKAQQFYHTTDIPTNVFQRVWIVPEEATIYENQNRAFVTEGRLKVMLEADYLNQQSMDSLTKPIVREVIIPELEKEVNSGKHFAKLRQIYHSYILATWYKERLFESIAEHPLQNYVAQKKIEGLETTEGLSKAEVYHRYINLFRQGVYEIIKEEYDPASESMIPRHYTSGGIELSKSFTTTDQAMLEPVGEMKQVVTDLEVPIGVDQAMKSSSIVGNEDFKRVLVSKIQSLFPDGHIVFNETSVSRHSAAVIKGEDPFQTPNARERHPTLKAVSVKVYDRKILEGYSERMKQAHLLASFNLTDGRTLEEDVNKIYFTAVRLQDTAATREVIYDANAMLWDRRAGEYQRKVEVVFKHIKARLNGRLSKKVTDEDLLDISRNVPGFTWLMIERMADEALTIKGKITKKKLNRVVKKFRQSRSGFPQQYHVLETGEEKGTGKFQPMMTLISELAREWNYDELVSFVSFPDGLPNIPLYEKVGFQVTGVGPEWMGDEVYEALSILKEDSISPRNLAWELMDQMYEQAKLEDRPMSELQRYIYISQEIQDKAMISQTPEYAVFYGGAWEKLTTNELKEKLGLPVDQHLQDYKNDGPVKIVSARLSTGIIGQPECRSGNCGPTGEHDVVLAVGDEGMRELVELGFIPCPTCQPGTIPGFSDAVGETVKKMYDLKSVEDFFDKNIMGFDVRRLDWEDLLLIVGGRPDLIFIEKGTDKTDLENRFKSMGFEPPEMAVYDRKKSQMNRIRRVGATSYQAPSRERYEMPEELLVSPGNQPDNLLDIISVVLDKTLKQLEGLLKEHRKRDVNFDSKEVITGIAGSTTYMKVNLTDPVPWDLIGDIDIFIFAPKTWEKDLKTVVPRRKQIMVFESLDEIFRRIFRQEMKKYTKKEVEPYIVQDSMLYQGTHLTGPYLSLVPKGDDGAFLYHPFNTYISSEERWKEVESKINGEFQAKYVYKLLTNYISLYKLLLFNDPWKAVRRLILLAQMRGDQEAVKELHQLALRRWERYQPTEEELLEYRERAKPLYKEAEIDMYVYQVFKEDLLFDTDEAMQTLSDSDPKKIQMDQIRRTLAQEYQPPARERFDLPEHLLQSSEKNLITIVETALEGTIEKVKRDLKKSFSLNAEDIIIQIAGSAAYLHDINSQKVNWDLIEDIDIFIYLPDDIERRADQFFLNHLFFQYLETEINQLVKKEVAVKVGRYRNLYDGNEMAMLYHPSQAYFGNPEIFQQQVEALSTDWQPHFVKQWFYHYRELYLEIKKLLDSNLVKKNRKAARRLLQLAYLRGDNQTAHRLYQIIQQGETEGESLKEVLEPFVQEAKPDFNGMHIQSFYFDLRDNRSHAKTDEAMQTQAPGGIDFHPRFLKMKRQGEEMMWEPFEDGMMIPSNFPGLIPRIQQILPVPNLQLLMSN